MPLYDIFTTAATEKHARECRIPIILQGTVNAVSGLAHLAILTPLGIHAVPLGVRVYIGPRGMVLWEQDTAKWHKAQRFTGDNAWRRADYAAKKLPYGGE